MGKLLLSFSSFNISIVYFIVLYCTVPNVTVFKPGMLATGQCSWFLKIVSVRTSVCVCVYVCVHPRGY